MKQKTLFKLNDYKSDFALAKKLKIKWDPRPWTRILSWGRNFKTALKYVLQNHLEAIQAIPYQPRRKRVLQVN